MQEKAEGKEGKSARGLSWGTERERSICPGGESGMHHAESLHCTRRRRSKVWGVAVHDRKADRKE